jgi:hypothetical protein
MVACFPAGTAGRKEWTQRAIDGWQSQQSKDKLLAYDSDFRDQLAMLLKRESDLGVYRQKPEDEKQKCAVSMYSVVQPLTAS